MYNLSWNTNSNSGFQIKNLSNNITTQYSVKDNLNGNFGYSVIMQSSQSSLSSLGYNTPLALPVLAFQGSGTYISIPISSVTMNGITFS